MEKKRRKFEKIGKQGNRQRRKILDFARDNGLVIHPGRGFDYYVEGFFRFGHCPCDDSRLACPCPEAIVECKNAGRCKCQLFWRDLETYKKSHVPEV